MHCCGLLRTFELWDARYGQFGGVVRGLMRAQMRGLWISPMRAPPKQLRARVFTYITEVHHGQMARLGTTGITSNYAPRLGSVFGQTPHKGRCRRILDQKLCNRQTAAGLYGHLPIINGTAKRTAHKTLDLAQFNIKVQLPAT